MDNEVSLEMYDEASGCWFALYQYDGTLSTEAEARSIIQGFRKLGSNGSYRVVITKYYVPAA